MRVLLCQVNVGDEDEAAVSLYFKLAKVPVLGVLFHLVQKKRKRQQLIRRKVWVKDVCANAVVDNHWE